jgi:nitroreductase
VIDGADRTELSMGELRAVMQAQRACRRFDPDGDVPDRDIELILDAAVHAPSAENSQPWVFVVMRSAGARAALSELWTAAWTAGGAEFVRSRTDDKVYADLDSGIMRGGFASAPVIVMVGADLDRVPEAFAPSSVYPAVQNILLAAADLGYGSCLTTGLTSTYVEPVRELLGLPETVLPMAAIYLGRPERRPGPPRRRPATESTYREHYKAPW